MRPIVVLIGLAALVVAACGSNAPASPSASAAATTSSAPSQALVSTPSPSTGMTFTIKLPEVGGTRVRVVVHDVNGVLAGVRAPTKAETKSVSNAFHGSNVAVTGGKSAKVLVVGWMGTACDKKVDIAVQGTNVVVAPAAVGTCIGKAVTRSVTLTFTTKIDPEAMTATYVAPAAQP
jgi:hypothetical protein